MMRNPGASAERIRGMLEKEFRQIFRDSRMTRLIFVAPILQLVLFGYAVSTDIRLTPTFVVDHDRSRAARELIEVVQASGHFHVTGTSDAPADLISALDHGKAIVGIEIPAGFAEQLAAGHATVQVLLDGTNSNTAGVAQGYLERILLSHGIRAAGAAGALPVDLRERAWFNPDLSSRDYNVPAVVGSLVLLVSLLLTSLAIVREREIGTLEQLNVSPLTAGEFIIGKTIPFGIIGLVDLALVTVVAHLWFGIPFEGSFWLLLAASVLYLLSALGIGLLISATSNTQQEAFMASFLVFMPAILLSGFMFPVSSMPAAFEWLTLLNPVRHYIEIVRTIFLKGTGIESLRSQFAALLILGVALLVIATARFRKGTA